MSHVAFWLDPSWVLASLVENASCLTREPPPSTGLEALCGGGSSLFSRLIILPTSSLQSSLLRSVQEPNDYDFWRMICRMRVRTGGKCVIGAACRNILHIDRCLTRSCTGADRRMRHASWSTEPKPVRRPCVAALRCFHVSSFCQRLHCKARCFAAFRSLMTMISGA